MDESTSYSNAPSEYENMEMENLYDKDAEEFEDNKMENGRLPFPGHLRMASSEFIDGILVRDLCFLSMVSSWII